MNFFIRSFVIVSLSLFVLISAPAWSQSAAAYIVQIKEAKTAAQFDALFSEMMVAFKSGRLAPIQHEEVMNVIQIAETSEFSSKILPQVYAWAGTMFGDGRMDQALVYFIESAELYGQQNKKLAQALACFEVAIIQHKAENLDEAQVYYERTLTYGKDSLPSRIIINCYNGFGLIERSKGQLSGALNQFKQAYQIAASTRDTVWMGILAGNMGSIHLRTNNYDSSLYYYFQNLGVVRNTLEFENEIETYTHIGKIYLLKSMPALSKLYLDSAVSIIRDRRIEFNDFFNPMDYINETYSSLYASIGDHKNAYEHYRRFHEAAEEKQNNVNSRSLKQLESTYAFNQKNSEIALLKKINDTNQQVIHQQRYITAGLAATFLILLAWGINAYRTSQERKKLNQDLHATNAELGRLNKVKDRLFSVLSHDLRSPIASLKSLVIILQDGEVNANDLSMMYSRIRHQLDTTSNVLESLLQWAKNEIADTQANIGEVVLGNVANEVALQLKTSFDEKNIQFINDLNYDLVALTDKFQIEIILRNLIANGIKFTNPGGQVRVHGKSTDDTIEVYVEDNGMGMHEEEVNKLFQSGGHFTKGGTLKEKGTGLGLLITREIIAKNGGNIWVKSKKEEGTKFTFTLPLANKPSHSLL